MDMRIEEWTEYQMKLSELTPAAVLRLTAGRARSWSQTARAACDLSRKVSEAALGPGRGENRVERAFGALALSRDGD